MTRAERMMESVCTPLIHMESEFRVDDEMILGNATQLNQVLLNVCVNAVHAIGKIKEISEYPAIQKKKKNWLRE